MAQDANYNVTAFLDDAGNVVERYAYDPFGQATVLDANWNVLAASAFAWVYLHQGGRLDGISGLYHFRHRDYSPSLGRWTSLDPLQYDAGDVNLYRTLRNSPSNYIDPIGLSDVQAHHAYPLYLGGADETQPLFQVTPKQHRAAEKVFEKYGVGNYNNRRLNDAARAKWAAMPLETQRKIIIESLRAAEVPDSIIMSNIDKIFEGAQPGTNRAPHLRAPKKGRVITRAMMQEAANLAKLGASLGAIVIFGGVSYAYDNYIETGWEGGTNLVNRATLKFELRRAWNSGELPATALERGFKLKWRDSVVLVRLEINREGEWIIARKVKLNDKGWITDFGEYILPPGSCPLDFRPGIWFFYR